jgi:putative flippase GtrA
VNVTTLLAGRAESLPVQFFRYGIVGGAAFVVDFATLVVLTDAVGLNYLASAAIAFTLGLATNYALSIRWVFASRSLESRTAEFTVFAVVGVLGLGLTEVVLFTGTNLAGLDYRLSKILAVALVFFWNFAARKALLFRQTRQQTHA